MDPTMMTELGAVGLALVAVNKLIDGLTSAYSKRSGNGHGNGAVTKQRLDDLWAAQQAEEQLLQTHLPSLAAHSELQTKMLEKQTSILDRMERKQVTAEGFAKMARDACPMKEKRVDGLG